MKLKRILPLFLAFGMLAGCGNSGSTATKNTEIVTELTEQVEITFWHAMSGEQEKSLTKLTEEFEASNPNVKVNLQNQSSYADLQQKITSTLPSPKNLPTMTQAYGDWMLTAIEDNLVQELDSYITNETLKFDNYEDILPGFREGGIIDGITYGIPFNKSTDVVWYNKTLFDELNIKVPTTYEEFADAAKQIYEKKNIPGAGFDSLQNYYTTYVKNEGQTYDPNYDVTSESSVNAVNYYLDGVKNGYFRIAGTDKYLSGPLGNEQIGMYVGSNAGESFVKQGVDGKFELGVTAYPAEYSMQQGTDLFMFSEASAEQKTAAYEYMKFLTSAESQLTWAKDTGYVPVRESVIKSEEYKNSGTLVAPILEETTKNLFVNPVSNGSASAVKESGTVLEAILADPTNADVTKSLEAFKTTLTSVWE